MPALADPPQQSLSQRPLSLRADLTGWHLLDPDHLLHRVAEHLAPEFAGVFGPETVYAFVADAYQRIAAEARIKTYLPTLTAQIARQALVEHARTQKDIHMTTIPEVLFVCVHNQGRSQMAAGLLAHHAQGRVHVRSAGSAPADSVNPVVVEAMAERGIDISQEFPKKLLTDDVAASDVVITMGCGDACPFVPSQGKEDWAIPDPKHLPPEEFRKVRDLVEAKVKDLIERAVKASV